VFGIDISESQVCFTNAIFDASHLPAGLNWSRRTPVVATTRWSRVAEIIGTTSRGTKIAAATAITTSGVLPN
jgi:hypothetical protein